MRIIGLKRLQCCSVSNATSKLSKFSWRIIRFAQRCRVNKNQSSFSKMHFLVLRYFALAVHLNHGGLIFSLFWDIYQNPMKVGDVRPGSQSWWRRQFACFFSSPTFGQEFAKWRLCMEFGKLWHLLVFKGGTLIKFAQIEPGQG